ncbi:MAG: FeoA family protein [Bacillota bacterium]
MSDARRITLSRLGVRRKGIIKQVLGGPWCQRLLDLGLVPDTPVEVLRRAPMSGPVACRVRGFCIALRSSEADQILVEEVQ